MKSTLGTGIDAPTELPTQLTGQVEAAADPIVVATSCSTAGRRACIGVPASGVVLVDLDALLVLVARRLELRATARGRARPRLEVAIAALFRLDGRLLRLQRLERLRGAGSSR